MCTIYSIVNCVLCICIAVFFILLFIVLYSYYNDIDLLANCPGIEPGINLKQTVSALTAEIILYFYDYMEARFFWRALAASLFTCFLYKALQLQKPSCAIHTYVSRNVVRVAI